MTGHGRTRRGFGSLISLLAALLCSVSTPAISAGGSVTYTYDALGRLIQVTYPNGVTVGYALDPAGNRTSVTTTQPPAAPGTPTISSITGSTATAAWTAPSSGTAAASYQYTLDGGASWVSVGSTTADLSGLTDDGTQYTFSVEACDAESGCGPEASVTFATAPSAPGAVTMSDIGGPTATATWGAATDNVGVAGYEYSLNGGASWTNVGNTLTTNLTGLTPATQYTFSVLAYDAVGTQGSTSSATFTTLDTIPPSAPGVPQISNVASTSATATWSAATDNVGVTGYEYSLNGGASWTNIGNTLTTNLSGLTPGTQYTLSVRAYDAAGNLGASSSSSFTTSDIVTDTLTMTQGEGTVFTPPYSYLFCYGYNPSTSGLYCPIPSGSLSPDTLSGGETVTAFYDSTAVQSEVVVSGFSSNPGQSWLISASATGITLSGSTATDYEYSNGSAYWLWIGSMFGFASSGTTSVSLTHLE